MKKIYLILFILISLILVGCTKEKEEPHIRYMVKVSDYITLYYNYDTNTYGADVYLASPNVITNTILSDEITEADDSDKTIIIPEEINGIKIDTILYIYIFGTNVGQIKIYIPSSIKHIVGYSIASIGKVHDIYYDGTMENFLSLFRDYCHRPHWVISKVNIHTKNENNEYEITHKIKLPNEVKDDYSSILDTVIHQIHTFIVPEDFKIEDSFGLIYPIELMFEKYTPNQGDAFLKESNNYIINTSSESNIIYGERYDYCLLDDKVVIFDVKHDEENMTIDDFNVDKIQLGKFAIASNNLKKLYLPYKNVKYYSSVSSLSFLYLEAEFENPNTDVFIDVSDYSRDLRSAPNLRIFVNKDGVPYEYDNILIPDLKYEDIDIVDDYIFAKINNKNYLIGTLLYFSYTLPLDYQNESYQVYDEYVFTFAREIYIEKLDMPIDDFISSQIHCVDYYINCDFESIANSNFLKWSNHKESTIFVKDENGNYVKVSD